MTPHRSWASVAPILDQIPLLAGPRCVAELSGGLTNLNLRVTNAAGDYVVRCFRGDAELLRIDREAEHANTAAAAEAGVAPAVVEFRPDLGLLVIDYIDGTTLDNDSFSVPGTIPRVAQACRTLHGGPAFVNDFDMFARQAGYLRTVSERGFALFPGYLDHVEAFARIQAALSVRADQVVPCNNDLLAANFVDDGAKIWLIDYEYAGNNDACFELGNISTECDLDASQVEDLVSAYFGRHLRNKLARTRLQSIVSQYGWSLWGCIQAATSDLEFDFEAWGLERYEKAARAFTAGDFESLLEEAGGAD